MDVYEVAVSRRSIRRFKDIPVPHQILGRCVNAARLAPSAANLQPLEYIVVNDDRLLAEVFATLGWAAYIRPAGDPPEGKRPKAYIVIVSSSAATAFTARITALAANRPLATLSSRPLMKIIGV